MMNRLTPPRSHAGNAEGRMLEAEFKLHHEILGSDCSGINRPCPALRDWERQASIHHTQI